MQQLATPAAIVSAVMFITASAAVNASFLAALGRTTLEACVLLSISLAADLAKLALPVLLVREAGRGSTFRVTLGGLLMVLVVVLSLASGAGFAAATRAGVAARSAAGADALAMLTRQISDLEARLSLLPPAPEPAVIEARIASRQTDPRWRLSQSCTQPPQPVRGWCQKVGGLDVELAAVKTRAALDGELRALNEKAIELRARGHGAEADPQAGAIASLIGVAPQTVRAVFAMFVACALEIGSIALVVLVLPHHAPAPAARTAAPAPPLTPAHVPPQADRSHWLRQRTRLAAAGTLEAQHDR